MFPVPEPLIWNGGLLFPPAPAFIVPGETGRGFNPVGPPKVSGTVAPSIGSGCFRAGPTASSVVPGEVRPETGDDPVADGEDRIGSAVMVGGGAGSGIAATGTGTAESPLGALAGLDAALFGCPSLFWFAGAFVRWIIGSGEPNSGSGGAEIVAGGAGIAAGCSKGAVAEAAGAWPCTELST